MNSQKWNCAASFPISTFRYLWAIYTVNSSYFAAVKLADRSCGYINCLQIHEYRSSERGRTVSFLGTFVSNFRYSVFAVYILKSSEKKTATEREKEEQKRAWVRGLRIVRRGRNRKLRGFKDCNEREEQKRMLRLDIMRRGDIVRGGLRDREMEE